MKGGSVPLDEEKLYRHQKPGKQVEISLGTTKSHDLVQDIGINLREKKLRIISGTLIEAVANVYDLANVSS